MRVCVLQARWMSWMWLWRDWRGVRGEARVVERRAERKRKVLVVVFMLGVVGSRFSEGWKGVSSMFNY